MNIDFKDMSPLPWAIGAVANKRPDGSIDCCVTGPLIPGDPAHDDKALGRLSADQHWLTAAGMAYEIMMRRGWHAIKDPGRSWGSWWLPVSIAATNELFEDWIVNHPFHDPFSAIIAADEWFKENIEDVKK